jgi:hypothetical protein
MQRKKLRLMLREEDGNILILTALLIAVFVGMLAFVLDLGHVHSVRYELQNGADACALRGARAFFPDNGPFDNSAFSAPRSVSQAWTTIGKNPTDAAPLKDLSDVIVGLWDYQKQAFEYAYPEESAGSFTWPPPMQYWGRYIGPAVSLTTKREQAEQNYGPVGMTLAQIFGVTAVPMGSLATAALSGVGSVGPGEVDLPMYISKDFFTQPDLDLWNSRINLYPEQPIENAGWFTPPDVKNTTPPELAKYILGPELGGKPFPSMQVSDGAFDSKDPPPYDYVYTQNGVDANLFKETQSCTPPKNHVGMLYWRWWYQTQCLGQPWIIQLPVLATSHQSNDPQPIVGFSEWEVVAVEEMPAKRIVIRPRSGVSPTGGGGGAFFGLLSLEPKLVR